MSEAPYQSFILPKMSSTHPLYVAFNHSLPGHYDATTGKNEGNSLSQLFWYTLFCRRQKEPAILISRLLLPMLGMDSFGLPLRMSISVVVQFYLW